MLFICNKCLNVFFISFHERLVVKAYTGNFLYEMWTHDFDLQAQTEQADSILWRHLNDLEITFQRHNTDADNVNDMRIPLLQYQ